MKTSLFIMVICNFIVPALHGAYALKEIHNTTPYEVTYQLCRKGLSRRKGGHLFVATHRIGDPITIEEGEVVSCMITPMGNEDDSGLCVEIARCTDHSKRDEEIATTSMGVRYFLFDGYNIAQEGLPEVIPSADYSKRRQETLLNSFGIVLRVAGYSYFIEYTPQRHYSQGVCIKTIDISSFNIAEVYEGLDTFGASMQGGAIILEERWCTCPFFGCLCPPVKFVAEEQERSYFMRVATCVSGYVGSLFCYEMCMGLGVVT